MRFLDLGPLQVEVNGLPTGSGGRHPAAVLETLLLHVNQQVPVYRLLDAVWGENVRPGSAGTLETHIWRLRRLLEPDRRRGEAPRLLVNDSNGYRLLAGPEQVDSQRVAQLGIEVVDLLATSQAARALEAAETALGLWRGTPFPEIADRTWAAGPVARLQEIRLQLQERRIDALLATGRPDTAVSDLETLVAEHPFRERLWWQRMLALYRVGRTEQALATYHLARRTLIDEIGLEHGPELAELQGRILAKDPTLQLLPPDLSARKVAVRLPRRRPRLIGRDADMRRVQDLLSTHRVVTLTGPAGCGKTALAVATAYAIAESYADGVCFVDLVTATAASDIAGEVTRAVRLPVRSHTTPLSALLGYCADRQMLIVLDNCEQVLDLCADLTEAVADRAPAVTILTTSREPLCVDGEQTHPVGPLATPAELFLERAHLPDGQLSAGDLVLVNRICQAVDGIALAVELAAALTTTFSLGEIADQVEQDPSALEAVGRGHPLHHQTLLSAIERSYRLLSDEEQRAYRRLAVLPGEFSAEAGGAVVGDSFCASPAAILTRLAHRSLVSSSRDPAGGPTRFRQLAPIRTHALRALTLAGEVDKAELARDEWTRDLAAARPPLGRAEERTWYAALRADLPTVRSTLHRRLAVERDPIGLELSVQLTGFWFYASLLDEGCSWAELTATSSWASNARPRADQLAQLSRAVLLVCVGRNDEARAAIHEVLDELESLPEAIGVSATALADVSSLADETTLRDLLLVAASAFSLARDPLTMRRIGDLVASRADSSNDPDAGAVLAALEALREVIDHPTSATLSKGKEAYSRAEASANHFAMWLAAATVTTVALEVGDARLGRTWSRRVMSAQQTLGAADITYQVETFGDFLAMDGYLIEAVRIFSSTRQYAWRVGAPWPRNPLTAELLDACRNTLSRNDFEQAWMVGPTMSRDQLTQEPAAVG